MATLIQANDVANNISLLVVSVWVARRIWPSMVARIAARRFDEASSFLYFAWIIAATTAATRIYWLPWYLLPPGNDLRTWLGGNAWVLQPAIASAVFAHLLCLYATHDGRSFARWSWRPAAAIAGMWSTVFLTAWAL